MRHRPVVTLLMLMIATILSLPAGAQREPVAPTPGSAKPFTQDQVQAMVRDGLGDETGAKAIEQRGLDFVPTEDFLQSLKAAGANEAFLQALRAAKHPQPAGEATKKPLNQVQVFALLAGQVPSHRVAMLVQERGIDFEPTDEYLEEVRLGGGEDELIGALKSARVTNPEHVDPGLQARQEEVRQHTARGGRLLAEKRYADAETEFRAAVRLDPNDEWTHLSLGMALHYKGDSDGAIGEFRDVLRLNPTSEMALVRTALGAMLGEKGDWDGDIAEEREAVRLNPNDDAAYDNLGLALAHKGDWDAAVVEYRSALSLNPNNDVAHANLGRALETKGDSAGAIAEYREAIRLNPHNDFAHCGLGVALGGQGDADGGIAQEREALRLNPENEFAHMVLGVALRAKGDLAGEISEEREALRLNPSDGLALLALGSALGAEGDWDGAIREYREAVRLDANDKVAHAALADALERMGDLPGALQEYRAAYLLDPTNSSYKRNYERLLQSTNK